MADKDELPYPPRTDGYVDCLTKAQEAALDELCKQLPSALEGLSAENLTLWGVSLVDLADDQHLISDFQQAGKPQELIDGAEPPKQQLDDASKDLKALWEPNRAQKVVLLKFLRARQFNVQAALTMLVDCLKWRRDFDVAGLASEMFPPQLAAAGQLSGRDRAGNPVTYNYYGSELNLESVFGSPGGVATFVRWRVKLMEQAVGLLDFEGGFEYVTQVHDYSGASMFGMNSQVKAASRQIIKLFQDNYPEMLSAKLFLNVPRVMEFVFGVFSAFCDAATRAKFVMASPARARAVLLQYIDPAQVPSRFGGFLETCSVPPNRGRANSFSHSSKKVVLKPGESHVTSKLVVPDSEVVWCFCTTGPEITVSVLFRPQDNGEAAAAAARLGDYVPGAAHPNSRYRDAQNITQSYHMAISKDAASGRLVLGCSGEVVMTLENIGTTGFFTRAQPIIVHYSLLASDTSPSGHSQALHQHGGLGSECNSEAIPSGPLFENGRPHPLDWRSRMLSYKSMGCSSFASNDVNGEPSAMEMAAAAAVAAVGEAPGAPWNVNDALGCRPQAQGQQVHPSGSTSGFAPVATSRFATGTQGERDAVA
ncbi:hypothetical protein Vretimale_17158 [Volvox reticuliferus]|uniref:CRAL-TRIO domain-containing protein n=1 Tax=Volvox reticuliferus TaxID=1737510 RepID=A0A8J4CVX5_9CHLO|nr:hypothetical protein Vretifemale_18579 [Volvox reticuliferus]GIM14143.1 hypothetical protein Vretimale_17158 [Volvox reticuliferus]